MLSEEYVNNFIINCSFIEQVVDCMYDWVRVVDFEGNVLYMNKAMSDGTGQRATGQKCFTAFGHKEPCANCITKKAYLSGVIHEKEERINNRIYSVMSSPMKDKNGTTFACVEVFRDVTLTKQLQKQVKDQNKIFRNELDTAKKLQLSLLPKEFEDERLEFSYFYNPCESLSGDFINIYRIDETHNGIYIADVSGHGVSSSILTVFLKSTLDKKLLSPAATLTKLYKDFNDIEMSNDLYITVFAAIIDTGKMELTYANAGHSVIPFVFGENRLDFLKSAGIPICDWLSEPSYQDKTIPLRHGDSLFLYTDGLVDLRNSENIQLGEENILQCLLSEKETADSKINKLKTLVEDFVGGEEALFHSKDDITMSVLNIK
jgi:Serine phosphatase RsbU, regulator of sigma subunit